DGSSCGSWGRWPMRVPAAGKASPAKSLSRPAMIRRGGLLPAPFAPGAPSCSRRWKGLAREVLVQPGHDPQERALARAVRSEDADLRPGIEGQPDPAQDLLPLGRDLAQVLHGED